MLKKQRFTENVTPIIVGLLHSVSTILVGGLNKVSIANECTSIAQQLLGSFLTLELPHQWL